MIATTRKSRETFPKWQSLVLLRVMRQKGNWIYQLRILTISDVSLINYRSSFIPKTDTWRNSSKCFFVKIFLQTATKNSMVVSLFTISFHFSVYDDIIKLTIEHLTFTLVHWEFSWCSLANRKINIHSCIQRTWLLLCEFYTFFSFSFSVDPRGWKEKLFFLCHSKVLRVFFLGNIVLCSSFIFNWSSLLWVVVSMCNLSGLVCFWKIQGFFECFMKFEDV